MLTTKTQVIRILLVDDHEVIRVGLRTVLDQTQGVAVIGEAGTMEGGSPASAEVEARRDLDGGHTDA